MTPEPRNTDTARFASAEAALRLSEATKSAILETALDCIVTIDHRGIVVDWNPAAEQTFGYPRTEAIGQEMAALIIPQSMQHMHRHGVSNAVRSGHDRMAGRRIEIVARKKSGEEIPVELAITRVAGGEAPLFTGHIRDITDRKRAEHALRESQQLLASITGNISEAIFRRSLRDGLIFVNEAYVKMFGYESMEELRTTPPEQLYKDPARRAEVVATLQSAGSLRNEEIEYRRKDGSTFWGLTNATGIRDDVTGKILYYDGGINDITDLKRRDQLQSVHYAVTRILADSPSLADAAPGILRNVCEGLHWDFGALWRVDSLEKEMRCVDLWNNGEKSSDAFAVASRKATFKSGSGLPGRVWSTGQPQWIPDVVPDKNFPRAKIAAANGLHSAFSFPIRLGAQVLGIMEFFSREIRQPDTEILEMFAAIGSQIGQFIQRTEAEANVHQLNRDLERRIAERTSELTRAQQDLVKALEQEKDLSRLKTNFVNLVSHEFRTPLGVIMSSAEIIQNYFERLMPAQRWSHLQDIRHATLQMTGLMEEVLLLGRVESGKMECRLQTLDLSEFCRRLVEEQLSATNNKCPIQLSLGKIPAQAAGDEGLLRHILTNLISNAVKYSQAGSEVTLSVKCESTMAIFEVCDQGIGIPAEDQPRLFEAFHRGQNVGEINGTGLGLVIVKRCVDLHDGEIALKSEVGRGTTFTVRLKLFNPATPAQKNLKPSGKKRK